MKITQKLIGLNKKIICISTAIFIIIAATATGLVINNYKVQANTKLLAENNIKLANAKIKAEKEKAQKAEEKKQAELKAQADENARLQKEAEEKEAEEKKQAELKAQADENAKLENEKKAEEKKQAEAKAAAAQQAPVPVQSNYVKIDVPYVNQKSPVYAPMGCEGASLLMGLKYKGINNLSYKDFLDKMPRSPNNNPFNGFAGSPYDVENAVFQSIFPGALSNYGKQYYSGVTDISGSSTSDLKKELDNGNPIVVYVTNRYFEAPRLATYNFGGTNYTIVDNMHVVLLAGYNNNDNTYYIADPNDKGYYWISRDKFEAAYNCLKWAISVR